MEGSLQCINSYLPLAVLFLLQLLLCVSLLLIFYLFIQFLGQLTAVTSFFVTTKPKHQFPTTKSRDRMELFKMDMWDLKSWPALLTHKYCFWVKDSHLRRTVTKSFYVAREIPWRISFSRTSWPRWAAAKYQTHLQFTQINPKQSRIK